jgi:hypothetical protein
VEPLYFSLLQSLPQIDIEVLAIEFLVAVNEALVENLFVFLMIWTLSCWLGLLLSLYVCGVRDRVFYVLLQKLRKSHLDIVRSLFSILAMAVANSEVMAEIATS